MSKTDKIEDYLIYGITGTPEIKKDEKKKYLGEFLERVVLAIEIDDLNEEFDSNKISDAIKNNSSVDKLIVNASLTNNVRIQCMKLAKTYNKDFKLVEGDTSIGIVLASNIAI